VKQALDFKSDHAAYIRAHMEWTKVRGRGGGANLRNIRVP
jgi:hypothetical protein